MLRLTLRVKHLSSANARLKTAKPKLVGFGRRCVQLECTKFFTFLPQPESPFTRGIGCRFESNIKVPGVMRLPTLADLKIVCTAIQPEVKLLTDVEKEIIYNSHPLSPYLSKTKKIPLHPIKGTVDFRFIDKPFFDDPVIAQLNTFKPSSGTTIQLQATSGAGKTGSILALAKKYFVLYLEVEGSQDEDALDMDLLFDSFLSEAHNMIKHIKDMDLSSRVQTELFTVMTQLVWLSQALLLQKTRERYPTLSPSDWIAYLLNGGGAEARNIYFALSKWFSEELHQNGLEIKYLGRLSPRLLTILGELTKEVFFAIDEAHVAVSLFPEIQFTSKMGYLSVLANYSRPTQQSCIMGTRMLQVDESVPGKCGESKLSLYNYNLSRESIDYPIVSEEKAIDLVSQYFNASLKDNLGLCEQIGYIAQGRIRQSADLCCFIWNENNSSASKDLSLDDMVTAGLQKLKTSISQNITKILDKMHEQFKNNSEWKNLLIILYTSAVSKDFLIDERMLSKLNINIEDLGFALVTKHVVAENQHFLSIKEPYSFEVFCTWLQSKAEFKPFIEQMN